ncbi:MAG: FecR domain-containing protein [Vicingaceae bacterium]
MKENNKHIDHTQLAKYLEGTLNAKERSAVETWIAAKEDNKKAFNAYQKIWEASLRYKEQSSHKVDTDAAWDKVLSQIQASEPKQPTIKPTTAWYSKAAIILAICLIGSLSYFFLIQQNNTTELVASEQQEVWLSDQSLITLEKDAKLIYPENFSGETRKVTLIGEALFEIEKSTKPFIIEASDVEITVLGTSFYVAASKEAKVVKVIVQSGKVAVKSKKSAEKVILTKGQEVVYHKQNKKFQLTNAQKDESSPSKDQKLKFRQTPLIDVLTTLEDRFNTSIQFDKKALKNCVFSGHFSSQNIDKIVKQIVISFGLNVQKEDNTFLISGKPNC